MPLAIALIALAQCSGSSCPRPAARPVAAHAAYTATTYRATYAVTATAAAPCSAPAVRHRRGLFGRIRGH